MLFTPLSYWRGHYGDCPKCRANAAVATALAKDKIAALRARSEERG